MTVARRVDIVQGTVLALSLMLLTTHQAISRSDTPMESEIRCCFSRAELSSEFRIILTKNYEKGQAHLYLESPSGERIGYDQQSGKFYKPSTTMVYAGGEHSAPMGIADPEDLRRRNYIVRLTDLEPGFYTVKVIGILDGDYYLNFRPAGGTSAGVRHFGAGKPIALRKGEVHTYRFNGQFADVRDGSIPMDDPRRFRVERIE